MKAPTAEDLERRRELDARRAAGADAWSPSRAREALRKHLGPPDHCRTENFTAGYLDGVSRAHVKAEEADAFSTSTAFKTWCLDNLGEVPRA